MNKTYFEGYLNISGWDILATDFPLVSVRHKSEPDAGSPCYKTGKIGAIAAGLEPLKVVSKRNGDFVVYYSDFVLKFWKDRSSK